MNVFDSDDYHGWKQKVRLARSSCTVSIINNIGYVVYIIYNLHRKSMQSSPQLQCHGLHSKFAYLMHIHMHGLKQIEL